MDYRKMNTDQVERLAKLEHDQWSAWAKHFLENSTPENIARWTRQAATPYAQLTEEEKEAEDGGHPEEGA